MSKSIKKPALKKTRVIFLVQLVSGCAIAKELGREVFKQTSWVRHTPGDSSAFCNLVTEMCTEVVRDGFMIKCDTTTLCAWHVSPSQIAFVKWWFAKGESIGG